MMNNVWFTRKIFGIIEAASCILLQVRAEQLRTQPARHPSLPRDTSWRLHCKTHNFQLSNHPCSAVRGSMPEPLLSWAESWRDKLSLIGFSSKGTTWWVVNLCCSWGTTCKFVSGRVYASVAPECWQFMQQQNPSNLPARFDSSYHSIHQKCWPLSLARDQGLDDFSKWF